MFFRDDINIGSSDLIFITIFFNQGLGWIFLICLASIFHDWSSYSTCTQEEPFCAVVLVRKNKQSKLSSAGGVWVSTPSSRGVRWTESPLQNLYGFVRPRDWFKITSDLLVSFFLFFLFSLFAFFQGTEKLLI